jgi:hypothetical protein
MQPTAVAAAQIEVENPATGDVVEAIAAASS